MAYQPWGSEVKWDGNMVFIRGRLLGIKNSFKVIVAHYEQNDYRKMTQQNSGLSISHPLLLPLTLGQLLLLLILM